MIKQLLLPFFLTGLLVLLLVGSSQAQIFVEGHNPSRWHGSGSGPQHALSASIGYLAWMDEKSVPLSGYSSSLAGYHTDFEAFNSTKLNGAFGLIIGYDHQLSERFALNTAFFTAKLINQMDGRFDLLSENNSRLTQFSVYSNYTINNPESRLLVQWLIGPELFYVKKDILIYEYQENENSIPDTYNQRVDILEGAALTGLGLSYRVAGSFRVFSTALIGISIPSGGLKATNTGLGLKVGF